MKRLWPLVFLLGCGLPTVDPPDVVIELPDDDDSADDDDDDSANPGDDDDAAGPDDDDVSTSPDRAGVVWVLDRHHWTLPDDAVHRGYAEGSFATDPAVPVTDLLGPDGFPLPGVLLHPDVDPFAGDEGCEAIAGDDARDPLPLSEDVGDALHLTAEGGGADLTIPRKGDLYTWAGADGPPDDAFGITLDGGASWPGSDTPGAFAFPAAPADVVPTPGTVSGAALGSLHVGWIPGGGEGRIEILVARYAAAADTSAWTAVRCLADDDGTFTIDASALIAAGSGDLRFAVTRAAWAVLDEDPAEGRPRLDTGSIRTVWYTATVGG